jgi:putative membrane protein
MKKINLILIAGIAALTFGACHQKTKVPDPIKEADSTNAANDTSKNDTTGKIAKIDDDDAKFMVRAASGGMAEVELGTLAAKKAVNPNVRAFGAMMVEDHSKANKKLTALATSIGVSLPQFPAKSEEDLDDKLIKKSPKDFDKAYVDAMVKDHQEDIKDFEKEINDAKSGAVKTFAQNTLPVLQKHLVAITAVQDSLEHKSK